MIWNRARLRQRAYRPARKHEPLVVEPDDPQVLALAREDDRACADCGLHLCSCDTAVLGSPRGLADSPPPRADDLPDGWRSMPGFCGDSDYESYRHIDTGARVWRYHVGEPWYVSPGGVVSTHIAATRAEAMELALEIVPEPVGADRDGWVNVGVADDRYVYRGDQDNGHVYKGTNGRWRWRGHHTYGPGRVALLEAQLAVERYAAGEVVQS